MSSIYRSRREKGDFKVYQDIIKFSGLIGNTFPNPRVLDIGPGAGVILKYFSDKGFRTSAIDISPKMIEVAREESPKTEYFLGNFLDYNFKGIKFEGIFAKAIFHLFTKEDAVRFVNKSDSLLTEGGLFYFSTFAHNVSKEGFIPKNTGGREFVRYSRDWTVDELESLIEKTPFNIIYTSNEQHGTMKKWSIILKK